MPSHNATTTQNYNLVDGNYSDIAHTVSNNRNRLLTVCISIDDDEDPSYVTSVEYDGEELSRVGRTKVGSAWGTVGEMWYILNPKSGTHNVKVFFGGATHFAVVMVSDWYNVEQTVPYDSAVDSQSGTDTTSVSVTPNNSSNIVISTFACGDYNASVSITDGTEVGDDQKGPHSDSHVMNVAYKENGSTGGETIEWTSSVSQRIVLVAATWNHEENVGCSKDLKIYYNTFDGENYICCWCSRWDVEDYSIIIETWMNKEDLMNLRNNIVPGAADELYTILGQPTYYDATWQAENTLYLVPTFGSRTEKLIYVKNINDSPLEGEKGYIDVKIEGYISGATR